MEGKVAKTRGMSLTEYAENHGGEPDRKEAIVPQMNAHPRKWKSTGYLLRASETSCLCAPLWPSVVHLFFSWIPGKFFTTESHRASQRGELDSGGRHHWPAGIQSFPIRVHWRSFAVKGRGRITLGKAVAGSQVWRTQLPIIESWHDRYRILSRCNHYPQTKPDFHH